MVEFSLRVAVASVAFAGTLLAASVAEARCSWNGLRSRNSSVPTSITFINQSGAYRALNWMDYKGLPQIYGGLNSGERKTLKTFLTHPWVVTDGPGTCIQVVTPQAGGSVVRLAGAMPRPTRGGQEGEAMTGCPPGTVAIPETDNCRPVRRGR